MATQKDLKSIKFPGMDVIYNINAIPIYDANGADYNMDTYFTQGAHVAIYRTNGDTLGTPKQQGLTTLNRALIFSYGSGTTYGFQMAFSSGGYIFVRRLNDGTISPWSRITQNVLTSGDYGSTLPTTNLQEGRLFFKLT